MGLYSVKYNRYRHVIKVKITEFLDFVHHSIPLFFYYHFCILFMEEFNLPSSLFNSCNIISVWSLYLTGMARLKTVLHKSTSFVRLCFQICSTSPLYRHIFLFTSDLPLTNQFVLENVTDTLLLKTFSIYRIQKFKNVLPTPCQVKGHMVTC